MRYFLYGTSGQRHALRNGGAQCSSFSAMTIGKNGSASCQVGIDVHHVSCGMQPELSPCLCSGGTISNLSGHRQALHTRQRGAKRFAGWGTGRSSSSNTAEPSPIAPNTTR